MVTKGWRKTKVVKKRGQEIQMIACLVCKNWSEYGTPRCPGCNSIFHYEDVSPRPDPTVVLAPQKPSEEVSHIKCPQCGHMEIKDSKFCSECGIKIQNNCPACNKLLSENAKFCSSCGFKL